MLSIKGWMNLYCRDASSIEPEKRPVWERIAAVLLVVILVSLFLLVLTPETGKDALIYHLGVPKLFLKHQGFYFIPGNIFANYPLHSEMLFLVGLFFHGDILAKGIHFLALLCILLGMWQFLRTWLENVYPVLSIVVFLSIPTVYITSHTANNDLFITLYSMAAVLSFINWYEDNHKGWILLCGIFSGFAVASKYTALILPMTGLFGILLVSKRRNSENKLLFQDMALYLMAIIITGSPFYIKNWIVTGNPFYPFMYGIFGGRGWDANQASNYDMFVSNLGMGRQLLDYLLLPFNLSFRAELNSPSFDGIVGPIFILVLPFLIGMRKISIQMKIIAIYCFITFIFWASSAQQLRYLIPILPFLAIMTGSVLTYYRNKKILFLAICVLVVGSLSFNLFYVTYDFTKNVSLNFLIGKESRETYLGRMLPSYQIFQFANRNLPSDSRIFLIYMRNWTYLCDLDCYSDSMFESYTIQKILSESLTAELVVQRLQKMRFTHVLYDERYIYGSLSLFSRDEKVLFSSLEKSYLQIVRKDGPYRLYYLK